MALGASAGLGGGDSRASALAAGPLSGPQRTPYEFRVFGSASYGYHVTFRVRLYPWSRRWLAQRPWSSEESRVAGRVDAVVFDVLETLLDLEPMGARLEEVGQPAAVLGPFFMRFQRDAMALTLARDVADFTATARQALRTETKQAMSDDEIAYVVEGFSEVPAFPDAVPALRKLSEAGVTIGCLTVGDPDNTRSVLATTGLEPYVDHVVTSDVVGVWKPAPDVYGYTAKALGCELDRMALVAVHAWDCHGAKRAGALAGWCSRLEGEPGDVFVPADVHGDDLVEVVDRLLAL